MVSNSWEYDSNIGISLDVTKTGEYYFYIPFTIFKSGEYSCTMFLNKNLQDNATNNPLKFGISTAPVIDYSTNSFDIINFSVYSDEYYIYLQEGVQYYLGAIDRLTWNQSGCSRVTFSEISIKEKEKNHFHIPLMIKNIY